jgi:hypothetical protein
LVSGEAVLVVVIGEVSMVGDGDGVLDDMRGFSVGSRVM